MRTRLKNNVEASSQPKSLKPCVGVKIKSGARAGGGPPPTGHSYP